MPNALSQEMNPLDGPTHFNKTAIRTTRIFVKDNKPSQYITPVSHRGL